MCRCGSEVVLYFTDKGHYPYSGLPISDCGKCSDKFGDKERCHTCGPYTFKVVSPEPMRCAPEPSCPAARPCMAPASINSGVAAAADARHSTTLGLHAAYTRPDCAYCCCQSGV